MIKVTISVKSEKLKLLPMFSVDDSVSYQNTKDILLENIDTLEKIIKAVNNGI